MRAELAEPAVEVCVNTVAKLMKEAEIRSVMSRRFVPQTTDSNHDLPVADNVRDRDFSADAPDRPFGCAQGGIVGWAMAEHMRTDLCLEALDMAVRSRTVGPELVHHRDRGSQHASSDYARVLQSSKVRASTSRTGNCYDNAAMESFWGSLKTEWVYPQKHDSLEQAKQSIFKYIELWYNGTVAADVARRSAT